MNAVREERRVRIHHAEELHRGGDVARLLTQLTERGLGRSLSRIDDSARDLEGDGARAVAVLPHHHDLALRRERHDVHPLLGVDAEERVEFVTPRPTGEHTMDAEHAAVLKRLALDDLPRTGKGHRRGC